MKLNWLFQIIMCRVFCIPFYRRLADYIKKTKYTTRCSAKSSTIYIEQFIEIRRNKFLIGVEKWSFRSVEYWPHRVLHFFRKRKVHNWNKLYFVDCRAFHAASYSIFCFFTKTYLLIKRWNKEKGISWLHRNKWCFHSVENWSHKISLFF